MYPTRPGRLHLVLAVCVLLVLLIVQQQQWVKLPANGHFEGAIPDSIHGSWFACVTWVLLQFTSRWTRGTATMIGATALIGLCLAVGTELLQKITGGDAEAGDVLFDMVGMSAALSFWSARRKLVPARIGVTVAVLLLIGSLWPGMHAVLDRPLSRLDCTGTRPLRFDLHNGPGQQRQQRDAGRAGARRMVDLWAGAEGHLGQRRLAGNTSR